METRSYWNEAVERKSLLLLTCIVIGEKQEGENSGSCEKERREQLVLRVRIVLDVEIEYIVEKRNKETVSIC